MVDVQQDGVESVPGHGRGEAAIRELVLHCHGFCPALDGHQGEDRTLFRDLAAAHPIAHLIGGLRAAIDRAAPPEERNRHLDGVAAIMENHFRYEVTRALQRGLAPSASYRANVV